MTLTDLALPLQPADCLLVSFNPKIDTFAYCSPIQQDSLSRANRAVPNTLEIVTSERRDFARFSSDSVPDPADFDPIPRHSWMVVQGWSAGEFLPEKYLQPNEPRRVESVMRCSTAYTYQADVYCESCGEDIKARIKLVSPGLVPEDEMDQSSYDSGDYPKSYCSDSDESDTPDHCAGCGEFLYNPLTREGYEYVKSALDSAGETLTETLRTWADYYGFCWYNDCQTCGFDPENCDCEQPKIVAEWRSFEMGD